MRLRDREEREQEPLSPSFKPPKEKKIQPNPRTHARESSAYRNIRNPLWALALGPVAKRKIGALKSEAIPEYRNIESA